MKKGLFKFSFKALDQKIVFLAAVTVFFIVAAAFFGVTYLTKEAFYKTEKEKANIIVNTAIPLLQMDLLLELEDQLFEILKAMKKNPDVEAVLLYKDGKLHEAVGKVPEENSLWKIEKDIFAPNTTRKLGKIVLYYKSTNFRHLYHQYLLWIGVIFLALFLALLFVAWYAKNLIKPFRVLANRLKSYTPPQVLDFTNILNNSDEIRSIKEALRNMQNKITSYSKELNEWNRTLERRVQEKTEELKHQFYTDSLTQLPNRLALVEEIESGHIGTLVILNIDDFKQVNDYFGHLVGDEILKKFSFYLKNEVEIDGKLYRLSGDEFAFAMRRALDKTQLEQLLTKLYNKVESFVFSYKEGEILIRVTMGAANQQYNILEKTDIALKYAKSKRKHFASYNRNLEMERTYKENLEWVHRIAKAIEEDRIVPYFQPISYATNKKVKGFEALMRMEENGQIVTPFQFIEVAKRSRFYPELTKIMFQKCCQYFQDKACPFSFNLSIEDIENEETVEFLEQTMKKFSLGERIVFEITETEGISNYDIVANFIQKMKSKGAQFSLDDFGSGYSNFEYLSKLQIDYIKIDGSLIKNILNDKNSLIIVETIVEYAKKRGIKSVAEFVSSQEIYEKVRELGVDFVQGFYIGKPAAEVEC